MVTTGAVTDRKLELLRFYADGVPEFGEESDGDARGFAAAFHELPALELRRRGADAPALSAANVRTALEYLDERQDCADFGLAALLRILYDHADSERLPDALAAEIEDGAAGFTYWLTEGEDASMCFWTENHQALFHSCQYLAGHRLPDRTFANGESGAWHRETGRERIERWLDWRLRFGFSEWHSNCYYEEDALALANLADFAPDEAIGRKAEAVLDLLCYHLAVHAHDGVFGAPHGRAYAPHLLDPPSEPVAPIRFLQFGLSGYRAAGLARGAAVLACSDYERPAILEAIARHDPDELESRERHSLDVEEAAAFGVDPEDPEALGFFLGAQVYNHRDVIETAAEVLPEEGHSPSEHVAEALAAYRRQEERAGSWRRLTYEPDPNCQAMTRADVYTYRTPAYMLSCAQSYRPGKVGFQQHVWQATLGARAPVFTTHPATEEFGTRPGYWQGSGVLPRAFAHRDVAVCAYRVEPSAGHPEYTHAFVPRHAFDEFRERAGWVFGRVGEGYVALRSARPTEWRAPDRGPNEAASEHVRRPLPDGADLPPFDLVAHGTRNVWVCQLGREARDGSFDAFVDAVAGATVEATPDAVTYESPSVGTVSAGWDRDLEVDGERVDVGDHDRFEDPYCSAAFGETRFELEHGERQHVIDPPK